MRKFIYLLLALPLFIAGCSNDPETLAPEQLTITLPAKGLTFDAEGGIGAIAYTITNAAEDATVEVTCDADWVTNIKINKNIVFSVLPNDDAERSAQMTISYKDQSFTVDIMQVGQVYDYDISFNNAIRIPVINEYPDNYCYLYLSNDSDAAFARLMMINEQNEIILKAGTYSDSQSNIEAEYSVLSINADTIVDLAACDASIVVGGDINGYTIDAKFVNAENRRCRLRFSGVIEGMADAYNHISTEPSSMEAHFIDGTYYALMYSPTFNYTIYISDVGIENDKFISNGTYYVLDLYGVMPEFDKDGYLIIPQGTYTFDPTNSLNEMTISNEYSSYFVMNEVANGQYAYALYDDAKLVVTEDGLTLDATINGAKHTVTYSGTTKFFVGTSEDRTFDADLLLGEYYSTQYSQTYNYNIFLTDLGFDNNGNPVPGSTHYSIDLYGLEPEIDADGYLHIPCGTYTLDSTGTYPEWSVGTSYTAYYKFDSNGNFEEESSFDTMTVVVSEGGITVDGYSLGAHHTVTYNGEPKFSME
ncbi:MAG: BACON domain-containing protein [Alistipes sp.]|nr:BACON domain-containing protein [Alistipes sp.]